MINPLRMPGQIATPPGCRPDNPPRLGRALAASVVLLLASALGTGGAAAAPPVGVVSAIGERATGEPLPKGAQIADPGAESLSSGAEEERRRAEQINRLRREVRRLSKPFDFVLYQSYAGNNREVSVTPGGTIGGIIPSQGGLQLTWRPPGIGLRNERIFEVFGRVLWANQADSFAPDFDTAQGGLGFRYKPLREQNLFVGFERLFALGRDAEDNWLVRATYGWGRGTDPQYGRDNWSMTSVYGDLGYFLRDPGVLAFYGELRQGWTFRRGQRWLITPHAVIDGRAQNPDESDVSYLEAGVGVSFKYLFNEDRYQAYGSSVEVLLQYKAPVVNFGSGLLLTGVVSF